MVETVKYLLSKSVEDIIASTDSLKLIGCYSKLYLNGAQCGFCANSQRNYYSEISKTGLKMAEKLEAVKTRTCKPAFIGLRLVIHPKNGHYHINPETLTDEQAMELLKLDILKEDQFEKLPDSYLTEVCKIEPKEYYAAEIEIKKKARKPKQ